MVVLKCKIFAQEYTCWKEIVLKQSCNELWFVKKCRNSTFKVNFLCQNQWNFFKKKIIQEYQFRRPLFVKNHTFSNFNFWTTLFSKIILNFWRTGAPRILKIQWFPLSILIFGQKFCFLGPNFNSTTELILILNVLNTLSGQTKRWLSPRTTKLDGPHSESLC